MAEDIFKVLKKEHREVLNILNQMEETRKTDSEKRKKLLSQLTQGLLPHMQAEENSLYKELGQEEEAFESVREAVEEHHVGRLILKELQGVSADGENWKAKATVLREIIEHHVEEEEGQIFDLAEDLLSEDQLDEILATFSREKEKYLAKI